MVKNELTYDRQRYTKFHKIMVDSIGYYQLDTLVYQKPTVNKRGIYLLVVIDVFSRKVGALIKNDNTAKTNLSTYQMILKQYFDNYPAQKIFTDGGSEFKDQFKQYMDENNTEIKVAKNDGLRDDNIHLPNSLVERVNGSLRKRINDYTSQYERELSPVMLDSIVHQYNESVHSSVGATPNSIWYGEDVPRIVLRKFNIPSRNSAPLEYKVGDRVRITLVVSKMSENSKRVELNSRDVYQIIAKDGNRYTLNNGLNLPYTRLIKTNDPITESASKKTKAKKPKNKDPNFTREEQEVRLRRLKGDEALVALNELNKDDKNFGMKEGKRQRKKKVILDL